MKLGYQMNLQQQQKLVMTPELKQSIEILQYSALELDQFISETLLTNPVLERGGDDSEGAVASADEGKSDFESKMDQIDWKQVSDDIQIKSQSRKYQEVAEDVSYDNLIVVEETLHDHLIGQLQLTTIDHKYLGLATYLIQCINPSGYLKLDKDHVMSFFNVDEDVLEELILTIQTFEPIGVGARDVQECLLIQLVYKGIEDKVVLGIVLNHLEDLAANRLDYIAKSLKVTLEQVKEAINLIRTLEPKPGREYASLQDIGYIKPDVNLVKTEDGYEIQVNESTAPRLHISRFYKKMLDQASQEGEASEYITKKLHGAMRVIKSIEQRRQTIYRVVACILEFQYDFFEKGPIYLRTLNLKDVADKIGVHESTVSRSTNGKYLQCPGGLYELKYFFQSGVSTSKGQGISSESIKTVMKEMIDKESPKKPLSDQAISLAFDKIGIKISRRTVAKYRTEMGILSTSKRKSF